MTNNHHANDVLMACNPQAICYVPDAPPGYWVEFTRMQFLRETNPHCYRLPIDKLWSENFHTLSIHEQKLAAAQFITTAQCYGELFGYLLILPDGHVREKAYTFEEVCCSEGAKGTGLGLYLVQSSVLYLKNIAARRISLVCNPAVKVGKKGRSLVDFYTQAGFRVIGPAPAKFVLPQL